jgi:hypothetical protein
MLYVHIFLNRCHWKHGKAVPLEYVWKTLCPGYSQGRKLLSLLEQGCVYMKMDYLSDSDTVSDQELDSNILQVSGSDSSISDVGFLDSDTASSNDLQAARTYLHFVNNEEYDPHQVQNKIKYGECYKIWSRNVVTCTHPTEILP